jgi:hypothetical protein
MHYIYIFMVSIMLLSCGGSSNSSQATFPDSSNDTQSNDTNETNSSDTNHTVKSIITGRAVDGEIAGATIFLDLNLNAKRDEGEPYTTTEDNGSFELELTSQTLIHANYLNQKALLILEGGFDIRSKSKFEQKLKANLDGNMTLHITPLSTMVANLVELNTTLENAREELAKSFNIPTNLINQDPLQLLESNEKRPYLAALKLHQVAKLIRHDEVDTNSSYQTLAKAFKNRDNTLATPMDALLQTDSYLKQCNNTQVVTHIINNLDLFINQKFNDIDNATLETTLIQHSISIEKATQSLDLKLKKCQLDDLNVTEEDNTTLAYQIVSKLLHDAHYTNQQIIEKISMLSEIDTKTTPQKLIEILKNSGEYDDVVSVLKNHYETMVDSSQTATLATNSDLSIKVKRTSDWNSGFCEEVEIHNTKSEPKIWNITIDVKGDIYTLWNASYHHDNTTDKLNAYGVAFNRSIDANGYTTFGYCANKTSSTSSTSPTSSTTPNDTNTSHYTNESLHVAQKIQSSWESGYCSDVTITNQSSEDKLWQVNFVTQGRINDLWNAKYIQDPQTLLVQAKGVAYNQIVKAYGSVTIGYCASLESDNQDVSPPQSTASPTLTDQESVAKDTQRLNFDRIKGLNSDTSNIKSNLNLPTLGEYGSHIVWSSSNLNALSHNGVIKRPVFGKGDAIVELNATLIKGDATQNKSFDLLIKELPNTQSSKVENYKNALDISMTFYEAQRATGPFQRVLWRKALNKEDGSDVDINLNGGWFDAGDHVKFNLPMSYSVTMLNWSMIDNPNSYKDLSYAKDQIKYALDYLSRSYYSGKSGIYSDDRVYYQVGNGHADHSFWGPPQDLTMDRPTSICSGDEGGCAAVSGSMAAAFASGYILLKDHDTPCANSLLSKAQEIYAFAKAYPTDHDYSDAAPFYQLFDDNKDQLAWGAIWLYLATHDENYLNDAKSFIVNKSPVGWVHNWDNVTAGVFLLISQSTNERSYHAAMEQSIEHWINNVPKSSAGLRVISEWGSLRYASTQAFIAAKYASITTNSDKKSSYLEFATSQIDYILGDNPLNFSYQIGFGENYPLNPHHRASHDSRIHDINSPALNTHILTGALVGGPLSANDYDYKDDRSDYKRNEVATDYNAGFSAALAQLIATIQ